MIVADTSLIAHFYLETEMSSLSESVYEKDPYWIFPLLWREEYANVLAKAARKDLKSVNDILKHFEYTVSELKDFEKTIDLSDVLRFAIKHKISVYDAHFVQLAENHDIMLVTEDKEIIKKCPHRAVSIHNFLTL